MQKMKEEIRQFVIDNFLFGRRTSLADGDSFIDRGILDSTGVLELVVFLEHRYSIKVLDDELIPDNLDSIDRIVVYLQGKQSVVSK